MPPLLVFFRGRLKGLFFSLPLLAPPVMPMLSMKYIDIFRLLSRHLQISLFRLLAIQKPLSHAKVLFPADADLIFGKFAWMSPRCDPA